MNPIAIEDPRLVLARNMMRMLREFCETTPEESAAESDGPARTLYQNMVSSCDVLDPAKGADSEIGGEALPKEH